MTKKLPVNTKEKVIASIDKCLTEWIKQKKTGKLTFEIFTGQGGINDSKLKAETKLT